ncbi:MAG: ubiquitin carboxyl-terminal hydrolase [Oligoflexia bacterium]|nr:ubiquitin carboxyl-terminal hydrolase [Oligoflexia bacterium]
MSGIRTTKTICIWVCYYILSMSLSLFLSLSFASQEESNSKDFNMSECIKKQMPMYEDDVTFINRFNYSESDRLIIEDRVVQFAKEDCLQMKQIEDTKKQKSRAQIQPQLEAEKKVVQEIMMKDCSLQESISPQNSKNFEMIKNLNAHTSKQLRQRTKRAKRAKRAERVVRKEVRRNKVNNKTNDGGLTNIGNTCYFNSAIQFISANPSLKKCIDKGAKDSRDEFRQLKPTFVLLKRVLKNIERGITSNEELMNELFNSFKLASHASYGKKNIEWNFEIGVQNDMDEAYKKLMAFLLQQVDCDKLLRIYFTYHMSDRKNKALTSKERQWNPSTEFELMINENNVEGENATVAGLLKNYFLPTDIEGYKIIKGRKNIKMDVRKHVDIDGSRLTPKYLTLVLKRQTYTFDENGNRIDRKVLTPVRVEERIIGKEINKNLKDNYSLLSFTCHLGRSSSGGHWVTVKHHKDKKSWVMLSDSSRPEVFASLDELIKNNPGCATGSSSFLYEKI